MLNARFLGGTVQISKEGVGGQVGGYCFWKVVSCFEGEAQLGEVDL